MTVIAGFEANGAIYLTADSAVRKDSDRDPFVSKRQVFEGVAKRDSGYVFEGAFKLAQISENAVVAMAGSEGFCIHLARYLRLRCGGRRCTEADIASLSAVVNAVSPTKDVAQLLIALHDGSPKLLQFCSSRNQYRLIPGDGWVLGTGDSRFEPAVKLAASYLRTIGLMGATATAAISSIMHAFSTSFDSYGVGVGGAFTSVDVSQAGVHLQPDTTYLLYSPAELERADARTGGGPSTIPEMAVITVLVRPSVLATVCGTQEAPDTTIITNDAINDEGEPDPEIIARCRSPEVDFESFYYAFISRRSPALLLHESPNGRLPTTHLQMYMVDEKTARMELSDELRTTLDSLGSDPNYFEAFPVEIRLLGNDFLEDDDDVATNEEDVFEGAT